MAKLRWAAVGPRTPDGAVGRLRRRRHIGQVVDKLAEHDLDNRSRDDEHHPKRDDHNHVVDNRGTDYDRCSNYDSSLHNRRADRSSNTSPNSPTDARSHGATDTSTDGATSAEL